MAAGIEKIKQTQEQRKHTCKKSKRKRDTTNKNAEQTPTPNNFQ